jgi:hypothetical protein
MHIHAPFTVDGNPPLGTYGTGSLAELAEVKESGMNLILGGHAQVDTTTPEGKFCGENGIKVLYHLTQHLYGNPQLAEPVDAEQTTIPLERVPGTQRDSHLIEIDNERIRYREMTATALVGCERGVDGTTPAAHRKGIILFWPEPFEAEVASVKDSPNLWGWYVLDDSPGDAISALRGMYRAVQRVDSARHPVCAGYGGAAAIHNFGPGVCDIMMIYFYPCMQGGYVRTFLSQEVQWLLSQARERVPGIPFIGVYQGFWGIDGFPDIPVTPHELREQMEDLVRDGACGLISFTARSKARNEGFDGWNSRADLREEMRRINEEIRRTGGLQVPQEPQELASLRIKPIGFWTNPQAIPGLVNAWHVVGPFADREKKILGAVFPPEHGIDLNATYEGTHGPMRWRVYSQEDAYQLTGVLGGEPTNTPEWLNEMNNVVAYATCTVTSPREQAAVLHIGSDDDAILWINGREVWRHDGGRGIHRDQDNARVTLPAGTSRILMKVYNRVGMWGASLRITDSEGAALPGLSISPTAADVEQP